MYVVRAADFVRMEAVQPHQVLLSSGLVHEHDVCCGSPAAFVSHQWCGRNCADPFFRQLRVLQGMLVNAAAGKVGIDPDFVSRALYAMRAPTRPSALRDAMSWHIWYDYFSVPQPDAPGPCSVGSSEHLDLCSGLGRAVASLAAYVKACAFFFVLAPRIEHEEGHVIDYISWKSRGWCRFERLARAMCSEGASMLFVRREDSLVEFTAHDYIFDPVGRGTFAVDGDRARLAVVVRELIRDRAALLLDAGRLDEYRCTLALRSALLQGLPLESATKPSCDWGDDDGGFLERLRLASPAGPLLDTAPLLLAARAGDLRAIRELLLARADIDCEEARAKRAFCIGRGQTPLHAAAWMGHSAAVYLLLQLRADAAARNRHSGSTALHSAGSTGRPAVLRALLRHRAALEARSAWGMTALEMCVTYRRHDGLVTLLSARASCGTSAEGLSPLHIASFCSAGLPILESLIHAEASVGAPYSPRVGSAMWLATFTMSVSYRMGTRTFLRGVCYNVCGATPLMFAVMGGNVAEAELLLSHRADPNAKNARGNSARRLADVFGTPVPQLAPTPVGS